MSGIMDEIKAKAKGTMSGPNGALVPGPGGEHHSNQRNQAAIDNQSGTQGNLGRGFDQGLDQGDNMNTYGTTSAAGHHGNTVGNIGQQSYAPQGTGFGGTTGSGVDHTGTHTGHGLHSHNTAPGVGTSNTPILGGEGAGHTGMGHTGTHTGHGMHGQHGHGMGTGAGTDSHLTHGTDQRTGHMLGDDSHSYGAGVGPDHKAGHKASKATKGAEYDATGGAVDDRTVGQKIKDAFTPGSDVGKHTKH